MTELSFQQFKIVHNTFSLMIAAMGLAVVVVLIQRREVSARYRECVTLLGLMAIIGAYSYFRLFESWNSAFSVLNGVVTRTGRPFDETYRYGEWLFTAPLILAAMLLLLDKAPRQARLKIFMPTAAAVGMVAAACAGQFLATPETRLVWALLSLGPFAAVLYYLYVSIAKDVHDQPSYARSLLVAARLATVTAWAGYQLVGAFPLFDVTGTAALVASQLGYACADLLALFGAGMLVLRVAVRGSAAEGQAIEQPAPLRRSVSGPAHRMKVDVGHYG